MRDKTMGATLAICLALILAGCTGRQVAARPSPPPPATAQGPVNPDAGVTTYNCADGRTIVAGYPDRDTAIVTYRDHAYTLKRVPSSRQARYTGYGLQWSVKAGRAVLSALKPDEETTSDPGMVCFAQDAGPAKAPVTETSFTPASSPRR